MQVKHVARISFTARGTAQQQRHLAVSPSLLGQVVVHDERILAAVAEVLAHSAAGVGRDVLHGRGLRRRHRHDGGVLHGAVLFELAHHRGNRGILLADGHVNAEQRLALLVGDGVYRERGLAGLAVADDQFALAAADGHHRVNGLVAGLHRLADRLARAHARCNLFDRRCQFRLDRALAVDRLAQRVHHAPQEFRTDRHLENATGGLDHVAFGDVLVVAQDHRAHRVALEIQRQAEGVLGEFQHFAVLRRLQAVDAHDAVGDAHHGAHVAHLGFGVEMLDTLPDERADFGWIELHEPGPRSLYRGGDRRSYWIMATVRRLNLSRTEPSITRSPARSTAPPINDLSVTQLSFTWRPNLLSSALRMRSCSVLSTDAAARISTSSTPSACSRRLAYSAAISGSSGRRRYSANSRTKLRSCGSGL